MHIATRKDIIGLNEGAGCIDHRKISVTYIIAVNTAEVLKVPPDSFRITAPYVTAPPTVITLRTKASTYLQQHTAVFDTAQEEVIHMQRLNIVNRSSFPNADFCYYWVNIVEFCRERWFGEFIKALRIYSRHVSAVSTELHFHDRLRITKR
jgi:hypothetical protein